MLLMEMQTETPIVSRRSTTADANLSHLSGTFGFRNGSALLQVNAAVEGCAVEK